MVLHTSTQDPLEKTFVEKTFRYFNLAIRQYRHFNMSKKLLEFIALGCLSLPAPGIGQLHLSKMFSSNMVLQRDQAIKVWGKAVPGNTVLVDFMQEHSQTVVRSDSSWTLELQRQKANALPQQMQVVSGGDTLVLRNLLIGDVWLCIGQSNMQMPMQQEMHFRSEILQTNSPRLRFLNPVYAGENTYNKPFSDADIQNLIPSAFYNGKWQNSDSNSFKTMSAVAYYFGKKIIESVNIPVGLVDLSIGGAPLETFISRDALKNSQAFAAKVSGNWLVNDALPVWVRERGRQNLEGLNNTPADDLGPNHPYKPGFAFEAGIREMVNFPVKGVLCYQGESNAQEPERVKEYRQLFRLLVDDYRRLWQDASLPFYWVQLSSIDTLHYKGQLWPEFRDEQRKLLDEISHGGMAVCSDMGARHDVHPTNKKPVGERLARWALHDVYQKGNIPSGPLPDRVVLRRGKVIIHFRYAGKGLLTADGKPVRGFSIDGMADAKAIIKGKTVQIAVQGKPSAVYYGWTPYTEANLANTALLPASTFRWIIQGN
jgi:sialate O-acetylesterase